MTIRRLGPDEYDKLHACDWLRPDRRPQPETSVVYVAEESGELQGFVVAQLVLCAEPIWVAPKKRGGTVALDLYRELEKELRTLSLRGIVTHATNKIWMSVLERLGFKSMKAVGYEKEF